MATRLTSVLFVASDAAALARFWADALGWAVGTEAPAEVTVESGAGAEWGDGGAPRLIFAPTGEVKAGKNRVHLDLASGSEGQQRDLVDRLRALGARPVDIGQRGVPWVVLADPEGNELCVLDPREEYQGTRDVAAVVVDCADPARLARFWSEATGWPPARSAADVAALRHPDRTATRLELLAVPTPAPARSRLRLAVAPYPGDDVAEEVARLEAAGARRIDVGQGDVAWAVTADPEGNELCVLSPR